MAAMAPSAPSQLDYARQPRRSRIVREDRDDFLTFVIPKFPLRTAAALVVIPYAGGWVAEAVFHAVIARFIPGFWQGFGKISIDILGACAIMLTILLIPVWLFRTRREVRVGADTIQWNSSSVFDDRDCEWRINEIDQIQEIKNAVVLVSTSGKELGRIGLPSGDEAVWMAGILRERFRIGRAITKERPGE